MEDGILILLTCLTLKTNAMKSVKVLLTGLLVFFAIGACEKDALNTEEAYLKVSVEEMEEIKMVPFKGNFISTPASTELIACAEPGTDPFQGPKFNLVSGNATHLGIMDTPNSTLLIESCFFDGDAGILSVTLNVTFKNKNGDGIRMLGISNISVAGPASGSYDVVEGFGKFEGAAGTITTTGFFNAETAVAEFSANGMVTQPNR